MQSVKLTRYRFWHIPVFAFFSRELYCQAALDWKGLNFGYLFLLLAVCWLPGMINAHLDLQEFASQQAPPVIEQIPRMVVDKGRLTVYAEQPCYIRDPESGTPLVVIDTTGRFASTDEANAPILVKCDRIEFVKSKGRETRSFSFKDVDEFTVTADLVRTWVNRFALYLMPILYPMALIGSWIYRVIQALVYAAIGMLFLSSLRIQLGYAAMLRLAVVAMTPAILLYTAVEWTDAALPGRISLPALVYLGVALGYLYFGVRACARRQSSQPPDPLPTLPRAV